MYSTEWIISWEFWLLALENVRDYIAFRAQWSYQWVLWLPPFMKSSENYSSKTHLHLLINFILSKVHLDQPTKSGTGPLTLSRLLLSRWRKAGSPHPQNNLICFTCKQAHDLLSIPQPNLHHKDKFSPPSNYFCKDFHALFDISQLRPSKQPSTATMSYAAVAAKGPKQTAEEVCIIIFKRILHSRYPSAGNICSSYCKISQACSHLLTLYTN
jgi:hypothetical protein